MLKKIWRPETGLFIVIWTILMIGGQSRFFQDPGTFWHTVVGEQMLSTHQLIIHDTFSFTFDGHPWSPHQWLGECIMALLNRHGQLDALLLATVTILSLLYTWVAFRLIRAGLHWSLAAVVVGLTVAASSSHFHIRPHIGTIVFLGLTMGFLCDFESGRASMARLFLLVPMYALWTNIHGGMLGGLATIILVIAGWIGMRLVGLESPLTGARQIITLGVLILACGLTALVNPYGTRLPQIWLDIMDSPILPRIIQEHAPLNPARPEGMMVILFGLFYAFVLVGIFPRWPRATWLIPIIWFYLACTRIRHSPLFAVSAAVAIADMLPHTRWARWMARPGSDWFQYRAFDRSRFGGFSMALPAMLVLATFICQQRGVTLPVVGQGWARLDSAYWPVQASAALARFEHAKPDGTPIFNEYLFGGYLIYFMPGYHVFVDDRCELYGDRWLQAYVEAEWQDTEAYIRQCQARYQQFDLALTRSGSGFDRYFGSSNEWVPLERSETATLYQRLGSSLRVLDNEAVSRARQ
jgi:hypothetical protein